jgi:hypothetical protein
LVAVRDFWPILGIPEVGLDVILDVSGMIVLRLSTLDVRSFLSGTSMRSNLALLVVVLLLLSILAGCAPSSNQSRATANDQGAIAGFWIGLWQGFIAPFVFILSLFKSSLNIYEIHNNGAWYNFAYLFGLACFFGGSGGRAARRKSGFRGNASGFDAN